MDAYFLKKDHILHFYSRIAEDFQLFVPRELTARPKVECLNGSISGSSALDYALSPFSEIANKEEIVFNEYRCLEPARVFFTRAREKLGNYFQNGGQPLNDKPAAICGIKNCDLFSLKIQDFVFLGGDEPDEFYQTNRQNALIISGDCTSFKEVCFCRAFDINPHANEGFDFNLSPLNDGFLLDVASAKAEKIALSIKDILQPASSGQLSARLQKRQAAIRHLESHLALHKIPGKETLKDIVVSGYNSKVWQEQMSTCVECGGCVFICDTCHCFLLFDEQTENARRMRIWDSCLFKNFTRVAGGANPLKMRYMRLRNRYLKKFDFFVDNIGFQACCGCGRCIEVCPGKIDIRYILRRLYEEKYIPAR